MPSFRTGGNCLVPGIEASEHVRGSVAVLKRHSCALVGKILLEPVLVTYGGAPVLVPVARIGEGEILVLVESQSGDAAVLPVRVDDGDVVGSGGGIIPVCKCNAVYCDGAERVGKIDRVDGDGVPVGAEGLGIPIITHLGAVVGGHVARRRELEHFSSDAVGREAELRRSVQVLERLVFILLAGNQGERCDGCDE